MAATAERNTSYEDSPEGSEVVSYGLPSDPLYLEFYMSSTTAELKTLLCDVITFYFMAQGCHWNVEGQDFSQYHSLFADIYEDVYGSIDPIAENLRKLGEYAPFNLQEFIDGRTLEFTAFKPTPKEMAKGLLESNDKLLKTIDKALKAAIKDNEQGIANFLADRDDHHKKWRWQLTASTK